MCMLTYYPEGVMPDAEALRNGAIYNNDGHGYAIVVPGRRPRIIVRHSMDAARLIERFTRDRAKYPDGPALFHSRYGTGGSVSKYNCHPFRVGRDKRTVIAHNGVLPATMQPSRNDSRSDTRYAAEELFPARYGKLWKEGTRDKIGAVIGRGNKLVILTVDPRYAGNAFLVNAAEGVWEGDIWYSNYQYLPPRVETAAWNMWDDWKGYAEWKERNDAAIAITAGDDWPELDCYTCLATNSVDPASAVCDICHACADCGEHVNDCLCVIAGEVSGGYSSVLDDPGHDYWTKMGA